MSLEIIRIIQNEVSGKYYVAGLEARSLEITTRNGTYLFDIDGLCLHNP